MTPKEFAEAYPGALVEHKGPYGIRQGRVVGYVLPSSIYYQGQESSIILEPVTPGGASYQSERFAQDIYWCVSRPPYIVVAHVNSLKVIQLKGQQAFPHPCPRCNSPSFILARTVECTNPKCPCYIPNATGAT